MRKKQAFFLGIFFFHYRKCNSLLIEEMAPRWDGKHRKTRSEVWELNLPFFTASPILSSGRIIQLSSRVLPCFPTHLRVFSESLVPVFFLKSIVSPFPSKSIIKFHNNNDMILVIYFKTGHFIVFRI